MKQLFTAGAGINIAPSTTDQTKQLISAKVDNDTIKVSSDGKLISQKLFTNLNEPLQIDAANNISIAYDGTTIVKDVDTGKLKSALTDNKLNQLKIKHRQQNNGYNGGWQTHCKVRNHRGRHRYLSCN